jgi:hypothetical protein
MNFNRIHTAERPLGYWVKHLDNLLEAQFATTLADLRLARRHWQVINSLRDGPRSRDDLTRALDPFWTQSRLELDAILDGQDGLASRGWITDDPHTSLVELTPAGQAAHHLVAARVRATRATLLAGLSDQQYADTLRVLAVIAANAESALRQPGESALRQPGESALCQPAERVHPENVPTPPAPGSAEVTIA